MSDLISKAAAIQAVFDWEQGKISGTIADAIAAIPTTDARYRKFSPAVQKHYVPYRCPSCTDAAQAQSPCPYGATGDDCCGGYCDMDDDQKGGDAHAVDPRHAPHAARPR